MPVQNSENKEEYQRLVQQVADRVWKLLREELRREQDRRGKKVR